MGAFSKAFGLVRQGTLLNYPLKFRQGFDSSFNFIQPEDFPALPCVFYRDKTDNFKVKSTFDFSQYTLNATELYVNKDSGSDTTGNGSSLNPYKTLAKAFTIARDGVDSKYKIIVQNTTPFLRDQTIPVITLTNKIVSVVPSNTLNRIIISNGNTGLTWTDLGSGVWRTSRTNTCAVYDFRVKDSNGVYIPLIAKNSQEDCSATINSWYTDGTLVYVHTPDGNVPTESTISVCVISGLPEVTLLGTSKLYLENCDFAIGSAVNCLLVKGDATGATVVGELCAKNCTFTGGNLRYDLSKLGNSIACENIKNTFLFNCNAAYSSRDGFNYHFTNVPDNQKRDCLVLEYSCKSYENGLNSNQTNNNATTCHESANIIRINGDYNQTTGPIIADVNGCYSILIDCNSVNSLSDLSAYFFSQNGAPVDIAGKVLIYNSTRAGETGDTTDLYVETGISATMYSSPFTNLLTGSITPNYEPPI